MEGDNSGRRNSNTQLLDELEALSQSMYQSHVSTNRRTASLALPRSSVPATASSGDEIAASNADETASLRPKSRRLSLSPFRTRTKLEAEALAKVISLPQGMKLDEKTTSVEKKGIWSWKPIRALSHIGMQKLSCLFSVEVVAVQGLPASMNGLRLSVCVRKKETKDGAVHTMPSRVSQGAADFEETLFLRCHVYCSGQGKQMKFESRPFLIYVFAVDAEELNFGRSSVDLIQLIQESIEKSNEGSRVRQWDTTFSLSGKAKGGELVLKLGFQVMEKDGGVGIYSQADGSKSDKSKLSSLSFARKQSKTSFSVPSPKISSRNAPSQAGSETASIQGIDDFKLDEPVAGLSNPSVQKSKELEPKIEDDMPDFEVVDKGVEIQDKEESKEEDSDGTVGAKSVSSEVVKEIVLDQVHLKRLSELDSIAQQIKALEAMMGKEKSVKKDSDTDSQRLDAEEENITKEFLQMLEDIGLDEFNLDQPEDTPVKAEGAKDASNEVESKVYLPDLGKGLGCVVQTKNGGFLAAMNPLDTEVSRRDTPKLVMQLSKPLLLSSQKSSNGFELFQRMAAIGMDELSSQILSLMPIDELMGKTAEQIAFEGMASAIIQGRNKGGASSVAANTISAVKSLATALSTGRKERISSGLWYVNEDPLTVEEILASSLQKIERMAIDAIKIQAGKAEDEAPFDVSPLNDKDQDHPLGNAVPLEDWLKNFNLYNSELEKQEPKTITLAVVIQLRDPIRRYEAVGGPLVALIQAIQADISLEKYAEDMRFKVASLHVGGLKVFRTGGRRGVWDAEKQRLTAMQWLVAYGLVKGEKKGKHPLSKGQDILWSISSRILADMWLKSIRNPDIKLQSK